MPSHRRSTPRAGPALHTMCLTEELFAAHVMRAVDKDLMAMKVIELKEELEARDEAKSGNKAWLRRRLHAAQRGARIDN